MSVLRSDLIVAADVDDLSRKATAEVARLATEAVSARGRFTVALSGGSTPRRLYRLLVEEDKLSPLPWGAIHLFWGDERHVAPDHPDSNYRMANEELLTRLPIPAANVHRIPAELADARAAAESYEQTLRSFFGLGPGDLPRFDLVLLGMGPDGHTASLLPGTPALDEEHRLVVGQWVQALGTWRITLSPPVLNNAAAVIFLVAGQDKAAALQQVLRGSRHPSVYPSQLIRPTSGRLLWLVDRAAARLLE